MRFHGASRLGRFWPGLFAAAVLILLLVPFPQTSRLVRSLTDMAHGPLFAALAIAAWALIEPTGVATGRRVWFGLALWGVLVAVGAATELLQGAVGRQPARQDVLADALGAGAGVLWMVGAPEGSAARRGFLRGFALLCLCVSVGRPLGVLADVAWQRWQMPTLASFECPLELTRWTAQECQLRRARRHATDGEWSLRLDLERGRYPGAALVHPTPDWSGYRVLVFDATLEGADSLGLVLKVVDRSHNWDTDDRFERRIRLVRGRQRIRVPLAEIRAAPARRAMSLRRIAMVQFFATNPERPVRVYLDDLHLE